MESLGVRHIIYKMSDVDWDKVLEYMYVCMNVCMYVRMYAFMYVCMYVNLFAVLLCSLKLSQKGYDDDT